MSERRNVRLVPLGGLGEIGMNCMGIEHGDDVLVLADGGEVLTDVPLDASLLDG